MGSLPAGLPFGDPDRYHRYGAYLRRRFGQAAQKVSIDAGLTCPNRDGTIGTGGCAYCDNDGFKPAYCRPTMPIAEQVEQGARFFLRKRDYAILAYFQSYTATHTTPERLRAMLCQATAPGYVAGAVVSTRPDCVPPQIIDILADANRRKPVMMEFGAESSRDATLELLGRGHTFAQVADAVRRCRQAGLTAGVHLILGLPGEGHAQMMATAQAVSRLPVDTVKLHQLQIVRGTRLEQMTARDPGLAPPIALDDYVALCADFAERLRPDIAIERFASQMQPQMLASRPWPPVRNAQVAQMVNRELARRESWQGKRAE